MLSGFLEASVIKQVELALSLTRYRRKRYVVISGSFLSFLHERYSQNSIILHVLIQLHSSIKDLL